MLFPSFVITSDHLHDVGDSGIGEEAAVVGVVTDCLVGSLAVVAVFQEDNRLDGDRGLVSTGAEGAHVYEYNTRRLKSSPFTARPQ